jgi:hypothetical protein
VQHFDRRRPVVPQVVGEENRGCPSAGELALDPIATGRPGPEARQQLHCGQWSGRRRPFSHPYCSDQRLRFGGRLCRVVLGEACA